MEYVVEEIRGERRIRRKGRSTTKFLVKWAGFDEETWEPISNLTNCRNKIEEFRSRQSVAAEEAAEEAVATEDAVDEEPDVSAQADSDATPQDGGESEVTAIIDDEPSPDIPTRDDETETEADSSRAVSTGSEVSTPSEPSEEAPIEPKRSGVDLHRTSERRLAGARHAAKNHQ
ncbi:hypothetical protein PINS_up015728 [Pythium insidiosum]|nr:hypothetical protein PINS_up015728 [Pythium insidiosum]